MRSLSCLILSILLSACAVPTAAPTVLPTSSPEPSLTATLTQTPSQAFTPSRTVTLTRTATPYQSPTATKTPGPPRAGMELIFTDEFEGEALDASVWSPCYPWDDQGCTNGGNAEGEWYLPDEVLLQDGLLRLRGRPNPVKGSDGKDYPYTSGMVSSHGKFYITYGYFEMRAKMPKGQGLWPAFWLLPESREWPPEIDILEVLGHEPFTVYTTLHFKISDSPHLSYGAPYTSPADLSADFHTYAVDWGPRQITWYLDDQPIYDVSVNIPAQPMYVIANLAVGGNWGGYPDETTEFPAFFDIDYIRVYRDPALPTPTPTPTSTPVK
jgi:beta-glucanase (GH16 family)